MISKLNSIILILKLNILNYTINTNNIIIYLQNHLTGYLIGIKLKIML